MVRRPAAVLALVIPCFAIGCHAGTSGNLAKSTPGPNREAVSKERFIALHNRNAQAIQSLEAAPRIELEEGGKHHSLKGRMALGRPNDFQLILAGGVKTEVANIGSNKDGFWFWVKDNPERELYTCSYQDVDASPLAATFQPDWIIEAMGLRVIEPAEARVISARPGDRPGVLILTQLRKDGRGEMLTKETVVDEKDGKILEHRLYSGAKAQLLARATIKEYQTKAVKLNPESPTETNIHYPSQFRLEWVAEKFALDIAMDDPRLNPKFTERQLTVLFHEPKIPGYKRVDLATLGGTDRATASASSSRIHETRPAPRSGSGSGVRLGEPQPLGTDGAMRTSSEPLALRPDFEDPAAEPLDLGNAPRPHPIDPVAPVAPSGVGLNRFRAPAR